MSHPVQYTWDMLLYDVYNKLAVSDPVIIPYLRQLRAFNFRIFNDTAKGQFNKTIFCKNASTTIPTAAISTGSIVTKGSKMEIKDNLDQKSL